MLREDFGAFLAKVFQTVSPGDAFVHNWHLDAIAYALTLILSGAGRRLIITQPPRSLKSISTSVAFVAWAIGHDPTLRFACVSYSTELATTLARQFRLVVASDWYKQTFPHVRLSKDTEIECQTSAGGGRIAVSVGGSFTGRGADVIIIDDPMKAEEAQSDLARRSVAGWYRTTLVSRLNDKQEGAIILVMQRLHEDDLAGQLLKEAGWDHLNLSAIAQQDERIAIGSHAVHIRRKGEALQPAREPLVVLDRIRAEMGSLTFSAQYLQEPVPLEGNLIKREWLKTYATGPSRGTGTQIVQSWDIASTLAETSDWSVCTTWLMVGRSYYLRHVWRGRLEFPALKHRLVELAKEHRSNRILIEQAGPGLHLLQELKANPTHGVSVPIGITPVGSKRERMEAQSARFEAGQVWLPQDAPWLADWLHELLAFPSGRHDDQVDSTSQFLNWAETRHLFEPTVSLSGPILIHL
jgi:predicted phage terminase large subunit-like protein